MEQLAKWYQGILLLALTVSLVTTPEQRAEWARQNDWNHYASRYSDLYTLP